MNLLLLTEPKISPFAQAMVDLTLSRLGPQRRQPPFSRARKVMGLFSFTIGCSFFFTWKARIFPVKVWHKNMGTWLECIYIYMFPISKYVYIYIMYCICMCRNKNMHIIISYLPYYWVPYPRVRLAPPPPEMTMFSLQVCRKFHQSVKKNILS